jgi:hypothetical protein
MLPMAVAPEAIRWYFTIFYRLKYFFFCITFYDMGTKEEVKPNFRTPPR